MIEIKVGDYLKFMQTQTARQSASLTQTKDIARLRVENLRYLCPVSFLVKSKGGQRLPSLGSASPWIWSKLIEAQTSRLEISTREPPIQCYRSCLVLVYLSACQEWTCSSPSPQSSVVLISGSVSDTLLFIRKIHIMHLEFIKCYIITDLLEGLKLGSTQWSRQS